MSNTVAKPPEKPKPQEKDSKVIRVSTAVDAYLRDHATVGETPDDVLRRLFKLPENPHKRGWRR